MPLTQKQIKHLKALAHHRKPVVMIGAAGVTAPVLTEIAIALKAHELIKVKLPALERAENASLLKRIGRFPEDRAIDDGQPDVRAA